MRALPPVLLASLVSLLAAAPRAQDEPPRWQPSQPDVAAGWTVLFDGVATDAWRGYRNDSFPTKGWRAENGALVHGKGGGGGDLITRRSFGDFELELQFRTGAGANSGILYLVTEQEPESYHTGAEFQVLDDAGAGVAADASNSAGALYGLYPPAGKQLRPAGEWNEARIVLRSGRIEHWLNGVRVVTAQLGSDDWNQRVAGSKFAAWQRFATAPRGHICLQDHGDEVAFRRIRVRELPPGSERLGDEVVLFDGKDLAAWDCHLPEGSQLSDVWSIRDGVLVCQGKPTGYLFTRQRFTSFVLRLQWRFDPDKGAGNSGVLLRLNGEHKVWPRSIEAQLHSGNAGDFWNIGEMQMQVDATRTRGRNTRKIHGNERPLGEWNQYEIVVDGPWVRLSVNGQVLNEAWGCEELAGPIALQSEGAEIHFRDVRLLPLKPR